MNARRLDDENGLLMRFKHLMEGAAEKQFTLIQDSAAPSSLDRYPKACP